MLRAAHAVFLRVCNCRHDRGRNRADRYERSSSSCGCWKWQFCRLFAGFAESQKRLGCIEIARLGSTAERRITDWHPPRVRACLAHVSLTEAVGHPKLYPTCFRLPHRPVHISVQIILFAIEPGPWVHLCTGYWELDLGLGETRRAATSARRQLPEMVTLRPGQEDRRTCSGSFSS